MLRVVRARLRDPHSLQERGPGCAKRGKSSSEISFQGQPGSGLRAWPGRQGPPLWSLSQLVAVGLVHERVRGSEEVNLMGKCSCGASCFLLVLETWWPSVSARLLWWRRQLLGSTWSWRTAGRPGGSLGRGSVGALGALQASSSHVGLDLDRELSI